MMWMRMMMTSFSEVVKNNYAVGRRIRDSSNIKEMVVFSFASGVGVAAVPQYRRLVRYLFEKVLSFTCRG